MEKNKNKNTPATQDPGGRQVRPIDKIFGALQGKKFTDQMQILTGKAPEQIKRYAMKVIYTIMTDRSASYTLQKCTPDSVVRSVITSASLGLDIDAKEHAYIVPYYNKNKHCYEAQFMPGYKGYIYKAKKAGDIKDIQNHIVYKNDRFKVSMGTDPRLEHEPDVLGEGYGDPENMIAVYSVVFYKNGMTNFEIMTRDQCLKIRDDLEKKYDGKESHIWRNNFTEMSRKTVTRRHAKRLQLDELADLAAIDDAVSGGRLVSKTSEKIEFHDDIGGEAGPEDPNVDPKMTPEKESLIKTIQINFDNLKYNEAKRVQMINKYLHVPELKFATIANLKNLYKATNEEIKAAGNGKKDSGK